MCGYMGCSSLDEDETQWKNACTSAVAMWLTILHFMLQMQRMPSYGLLYCFSGVCHVHFHKSINQILCFYLVSWIVPHRSIPRCYIVQKGIRLGQQSLLKFHMRPLPLLQLTHCWDCCGIHVDNESMLERLRSWEEERESVESMQAHRKNFG